MSLDTPPYEFLCGCDFCVYFLYSKFCPVFIQHCILTERVLKYFSSTLNMVK